MSHPCPTEDQRRIAHRLYALLKSRAPPGTRTPNPRIKSTRYFAAPAGAAFCCPVPRGATPVCYVLPRGAAQCQNRRSPIDHPSGSPPRRARPATTDVRPNIQPAPTARWTRTRRRELLARTFIWNQQHAFHGYETFYNAHRPNQGIGNARPLARLREPVTSPAQLARLRIRRHNRLGELLH